MSDAYVDEKSTDGSWLRTFSASVDSKELVWHRDHKTREITICHGTGWSFQMDNQLPLMLIKGDHFSINRMTYHRLIKGKDDLCIRIKENDL